MVFSRCCDSCRLSQFGLLQLHQVTHVEVVVGLEPVLVGFDGERTERAEETARGGWNS